MTKYLMTAAVLLPLMAATGVANAGAGVSDKRFFPDQARPAPTYKVETKAAGASSAHGPTISGVNHRYEYRGGPKSPLVHSWQP